MKKCLNYDTAFANALCEEFDPEKMAGGADNFSRGSKELMSEAQKELVEEENKRKKEEMKKQLAVNAFDQDAAAIKLRKDKAVTAANTKELKERTSLNEDFKTNGGEVKELREKLSKIDDIRCKEIEVAFATYSAAIANLKAKNPDGYRNSLKRYDY